MIINLQISVKLNLILVCIGKFCLTEASLVFGRTYYCNQFWKSWIQSMVNASWFLTAMVSELKIDLSFAVPVKIIIISVCLSFLTHFRSFLEWWHLFWQDFLDKRFDVCSFRIFVSLTSRIDFLWNFDINDQLNVIQKIPEWSLHQSLIT